jgi:hypothetical protein
MELLATNPFTFQPPINAQRKRRSRNSARRGWFQSLLLPDFLTGLTSVFNQVGGKWERILLRKAKILEAGLYLLIREVDLPGWIDVPGGLLALATLL